MKKNSKKTQETQETQETHMAIFCIPLISFTLKKGMGKIKEIPETQERHETHETPVVILFFIHCRSITGRFCHSLCAFQSE
jgi:hypothetical protein